MNWRLAIMVTMALAGPAALAGVPAGATTLTIAARPGAAWGKAKEVPGTAALNKGSFAQIYSLSCARAATCSAGGFYTASGRHPQAFVVSQT